jgi:hypothetical protein
MGKPLQVRGDDGGQPALAAQPGEKGVQCVALI